MRRGGGGELRRRWLRGLRRGWGGRGRGWVRWAFFIFGGGGGGGIVYWGLGELGDG